MYPVSYEADFNAAPNRWTTFFRIILAIPWFIVGVFWAMLFAFTHFFAWVAVIVLGRYPAWLYEFNSGVVRYWVRVSAWVYLQTDEWPPFTLRDDPSYPIRVNVAPARHESEPAEGLLPLLLALPVVLIVSYAVRPILLGLGLIAWLTIVFRGYMPEMVNNALTFVNGFDARVLGYIAILTDDYPPIGLEKAAPIASPAAPVVPPPAV